MSTKENNEVAVEKVTENDKASGDAKCEIKGIKRPAEVSKGAYAPSCANRVGGRAVVLARVNARFSRRYISISCAALR